MPKLQRGAYAFQYMDDAKANKITLTRVLDDPLFVTRPAYDRRVKKPAPARSFTISRPAIRISR